MHMLSPLFALTLIPAAFALPAAEVSPAVPVVNKRQGALDLHPFHLPKLVNLADRAFVGFDNEGPANVEEERGEASVSVVDVKDASTLTSLIMFNPSSTLPTSDNPASATGSSISLSTLSEGQSAAFNPTATTTLSLLNGDPTALGLSSSASRSSAGRSIPESIQTSGGKFTPYSNADVIATTSATGSGVVAAAASEGSSTTSGGVRLRPLAGRSISILLSVGALVVSSCIRI
ncbi:hypothetical protein I316_06219 [Kwoniella heveanensis BCC8398]|uniref:Uncharacterized protein n=1 Tax=Kwoniella heveanensis BCC8398 TaxID=1296120 RepID=A0A1B9GM42_9TREE|nr:hypothetical protein I316_06219 [Kwoniella heveanensis BCC8398]